MKMKPKEFIKYMEEKGIKGNELAKTLGISRVSVANIRNGQTEKLNMIYVERAAKRLNMTTAELVAKLE